MIRVFAYGTKTVIYYTTLFRQNREHPIFSPRNNFVSDLKLGWLGISAEIDFEIRRKRGLAAYPRLLVNLQISSLRLSPIALFVQNFPQKLSLSSPTQ